MKLTFQATDLDITVTTDKDEVIYSYQAKDIKAAFNTATGLQALIELMQTASRARDLIKQEMQ